MQHISVSKRDEWKQNWISHTSQIYSLPTPIVYIVGSVLFNIKPPIFGFFFVSCKFYSRCRMYIDARRYIMCTQKKIPFRFSLALFVVNWEKKNTSFQKTSSLKWYTANFHRNKLFNLRCECHINRKTHHIHFTYSNKLYI